MACPLVSGNLKDDLIFIVFVSQERFFHISSGGAAALQFVACQVEPNQSRQTPQRVTPHTALRKCHFSASEGSGACHFTSLLITLTLKTSFTNVLNEGKKHQARSLFCVCVIRDLSVPGLKLSFGRDARLKLATNAGGFQGTLALSGHAAKEHGTRIILQYLTSAVSHVLGLLFSSEKSPSSELSEMMKEGIRAEC